MNHEVYFTNPSTGKPDSVMLSEQQYEELMSDISSAKYNETIHLPGFGNVTKQAYKGDKEIGNSSRKPPTDPSWPGYHLVGNSTSKIVGDDIVETYRRTKEYPDGRSKFHDEVETSRISIEESKKNVRPRNHRVLS